MAVALGADGWHASVAQVQALRVRPSLPLCLCSAHDPADLQRARALGFDAAVLGTVKQSASHPDAAILGFGKAAQWTCEANLPVYWIGGLHRDDLPARSEEHTSELQSLMRISYAVLCLKKQK